MQEEIAHSPQYNDRGKIDLFPAGKAPGLEMLRETLALALILRIVLSKAKNNSEQMKHATLHTVVYRQEGHVTLARGG